MSKRTCIECGVSIEGTKRLKFCSDLCNWRVKERRKKASGYYQREDVRERRNRQFRERYQGAISEGRHPAEYKRRKNRHKWTLNCLHCDGLIDEPNAVRKYCSNACLIEARRIRKRANRRNWADYELRNQHSTHKRRAIRYGVHYELFDKIDVFERDNWKCGICGKLVDRSSVFPDPFSASLDHIVPMSLGGAHSADNTQCSHLSCNLRKGVEYV